METETHRDGRWDFIEASLVEGFLYQKDED